ncbi:MAG: DUF4159 domain-containing protein [Pirellulales bacterium]
MTRLAVLVVCALLSGVFARGAWAAEITAEEVRESIAVGVDYLKKQQHPQGNWSELVPIHSSGVSALCTLALLQCGESPDSKHVKQALKYLEQVNPTTTYVASLHVMVYCAADPVRYKIRIGQLAKWIESHQRTKGDTRGGWAYPEQGNGDNSNTQFAMLALHEAEKVGVEISDKTWRMALEYWTHAEMQHRDGSWGYIRKDASTGSMTCAGIASVIIAQDRLAARDAITNGGTIQCCGGSEESDSIERALNWMAKKFTTRTNPNSLGLGDSSRSEIWLLYYLYGVERVGRMSGQRLLGDHDWYREGCEFLVEKQRESVNGSWTGTGTAESNPIIGTSLALLFLSKGRRPVVIGKLKHDLMAGGFGRDWDHHRRAIQNLTGRIEKLWRKELSWQTVDISTASVADMLETPVLFLSGSQGLKLSPQQKQNLRDYLNQGGFLFAEACDGNGCDGRQFDRDFRALMAELFPDSELRKLPPDHAVWFAQEVIKPDDLPKEKNFWLWGLDTCCRTSVVYCPKSLSCRWELAFPYRALTLPDGVRGEVDVCARLGANVVAYATNRQLKEKLDRPTVTLNVDKSKLDLGAFVLPKLSHGGGADDAPNAVNNLLMVLEQKLEMRVDLHKRIFAADDKAILDHPLLFLHGRTGFRFSAAERTVLSEYLKNGGVLFADSICGNNEFAKSFREEVLMIFPQAKFEKLAEGHPLFTEEFNGFDVRRVKLRDPLRRNADGPLDAQLVTVPPLLEVLEVDGRVVAVLSPYDLSCALEKGTSLECKGYIPEDAARIGANVILYVLRN